jgi:hypothetical protein
MLLCTGETKICCGSVGAGTGAATGFISPRRSSVRELKAFALAYTGGNARPNMSSARDCDICLNAPKFVFETELCEAAEDGGRSIPVGCPLDGAAERGPAASRDLEGLASLVLSSKNAEVAAIRGEKSRRNGRRLSSSCLSKVPTSCRRFYIRHVKSSLQKQEEESEEELRAQCRDSIYLPLQLLNASNFASMILIELFELQSQQAELG